VASVIAEHWEGKLEVAVATALLQRNHWWVVLISEGEAIQAPSETVNVSPLALVPETSGLVVTTGALVMIALEAVNTVERPTELRASTLAKTYFPIRELSTKLRLAPVADGISLQPLGTFIVLAAANTSLAQTNHW
jgi:hypothetical protein